jgi:hypothetical protein
LSILAVGLLITATDNNLNVAFYVFSVGTVIFIALSFFAKVEPSDSDYIDEDNLDQASQPLLKQHLGTNYVWPPDHPADSEDDDFQSSIATHHGIGQLVDRRDSHVSFANTVMSDEHGRRHSLRLHRTATSVARDVHLEASEMMESLDRIPSLGLALSHIPSMETSLAFLIPHSEDDIVAPPTSLLKSLKVVTFLLTMLIFGVSFSMINQFLFLFLHNDLGVESSTLGWTGPVGGVTEVLTFWVSKQVNFQNHHLSSFLMCEKTFYLYSHHTFEMLLSFYCLTLALRSFRCHLVDGLRAWHYDHTILPVYPFATKRTNDEYICTCVTNIERSGFCHRMVDSS